MWIWREQTELGFNIRLNIYYSTESNILSFPESFIFFIPL